MASKTKNQETLMKYLTQDLHLYQQQLELNSRNQTREFLEAKELQLKEELDDPTIISESAQNLTKIIQVLRPHIESLLRVTDDPTSSTKNIILGSNQTTTNGVIAATHDEETCQASSSQAVVSTHDEDKKLESLRTIFLKDPDQFEALKLVLGLQNQEEVEEDEVVKKKRPNWRWAFYGLLANSTINALLEIAKTHYNLDALFGMENSRKEVGAATTKNRADVNDVDAKKKMLDKLAAAAATAKNKADVGDVDAKKKMLDKLAAAAATAKNKADVGDVDAKKNRLENKRLRKMKWMLESFDERQRQSKIRLKQNEREGKLGKRRVDALAETDVDVDVMKRMLKIAEQRKIRMLKIPEERKIRMLEIAERKKRRMLEKIEKNRKNTLERRMAMAVAEDGRGNKAESDLNVDDSRMIVPQMNVDEAEVDVDVKKKIVETSKESTKKRKLKNLTEQRKKRKLEAVENAASDPNVDDSQIIVAQMNVYEADSVVNVKKNIPMSKKWSLDKLANKKKRLENWKAREMARKEHGDKVESENIPMSKKWSLDKLANKKKRLENWKAREMARKEHGDKVESDLNADDFQMSVAQMNVNEVYADVNVKKNIPETSKEREEEEPEQVNGKEEEEEVGEEMAQAVAEDEHEDKVESDLNVDDSQMTVAQINVDEVNADINVKKKVRETSKEREEEEPKQFKRKVEEDEVGEERQAVAEDERDDKVESVTLGGQTISADGK